MRANQLHGIFYQRGLVFLLAVLVLLMVGFASVLLFIGGNAALTGQRLKRETTDIARLKVVRDALIGYAVGAYGGGSRPGQLPRPDTLEGSPAVGSYDGKENLGCLDSTKLNGLPPLSGTSAKSPNLRCVGRTPWRELGLQPETLDENDPLGSIVWYAVSANLADPNFCLERLNSGTIALAHDATAPFVCRNAAPPFPWLKVCSESGRVLKDRVAFVLMLPGKPITTHGRMQQRSQNIKPQPGDFLDAIPLPSGWPSIPAADRCSTYDNAGLTNEFVIATQSETFNDILVYVTVDELAAEIERRIAFEVRASIDSFVNLRGAFPWLAPLADPTLSASYVPLPGKLALAGLVPFYTTNPSNDFFTELGWTISAPPGSVSSSGASLVTPASCTINGATQFCRLRSSTGGSIPNSVTIPDVEAYFTLDINVPTAQCRWTADKDNRAKCSYLFSPLLTIPQTYQLETGISATGPWTSCGVFAGNNIKTLKVEFDFLARPEPPAFNPAFTPATLTSVMQREVRNNSTSLSNVIELVENFSPSSSNTICGTTSLTGDLPLVGRRYSIGLGAIAVRKIRVYPALPEWYFAEQWYQYIYAALSPDVTPNLGKTSCNKAGTNCLISEGTKGLEAVVIAIGKPLAGQSRTSSFPENFLEGKNKDGGTTKVFASSIEPRSETYVDFVAPLVR
jgi:hypothetical protein